MTGVAALLKKDLRVTLNLRRVLREQSSFKVVFILLFASGMLFGLWALFLEGFWFLDSLGGVGLMLISRLFALFFLGLGLMLVLSSIITSYTTLFGSDETAFLLLKPLTISEITVYKLIQSSFYSSWAFFFTIIPFVGAYAWHEQLSVFFSVWTLLFSVPLVILCASVGMMVCMLAAKWLPRSRALWVTVFLVILPVLWWIASTASAAARSDNDTTLVLGRLIPGLQVASNPFWPSWWVSEGIMSLTRGQWGRGFMLWLLLVSTTLLVAMIVEWMGRKLFYDGWQRARYAAVRNTRKGTLFGFAEPAMGWMPTDIRALILKDVRTFFRDPAQWSQGLIFFGLLALYFLNLRNLNYHILPAQWRNLISFLNVFSVSAVLCSFGSRFVYPQLSLEGHGFWIIGMAPTTMGRVLVAKFIVACAGMSVVSVALMYLSTKMLIVDPLTQAVAIGVALSISISISGLSTGLEIGRAHV